MTQQTYHKPPRKKGKYNSDYRTRDIHSYYLNNRKSDSKVSREQFSSVLKDFNTRIIKDIIYNNFEFKLPFRMGVISVKKVMPKGIELDEDGNIIDRKLVVDYYKTNELWKSDSEAYKKRKKVYLLNEHSNGWIYRFYWDRGKFINASHYIFKATVRNKQYLRDAILSDRDLDFYEIKAKKYHVQR